MSTDNCSVCLYPINHLTQKVAITLPCFHIFHTKCILPGLTSTDGRCPNCMVDVTNISFRRRQTTEQPPSPSPSQQSPEINIQETIAELLGRMSELEFLEERNAPLENPSRITYDEAVLILNEGTRRYNDIIQLVELGDSIYIDYPHEATGLERYQYLRAVQPEFMNMYDRIHSVYAMIRENMDYANRIVNNVRGIEVEEHPLLEHRDERS